MKTRTLLILLCCTASAFAQQRKVRSISWQRKVVDREWDSKLPAETKDILKIYKEKVDSVMSPALGLSRRPMSVSRPESLLSNWMADMLLLESTATGMPQADMALINMGGLRADMPEDIVTAGHVFQIAPFENKLVIVEMQGDDLLELMHNIASVGGEGVSHTVALRISKDNKLIEAKINGEPIDPKRTYTVATIDYLAAGNDKMVALKKSKAIHKTNLLLRDVTMEHIIKKRIIDSKLDGRITVVGE